MLFIVSFVDLQLFDNRPIVEECTLENKYKIIVMIDTESDDYEFINLVTAQEVCKMLKIESVELIKYKIAKDYNDKKKPFITHVIYSKMIIEPHSKNLAVLMIIFFANHLIILNRPWLMKHEVIIDVDVINSKKSMLKWKKNHCIHFDAFDFSFSLLSNKKSKELTKKTTKTTSNQFMKIFIRSSKNLKIISNKESSFALTPMNFSKKKSIESNSSSNSTQSKSKKTSRTKKKRMLNESWKDSIESSKKIIKSKQKNIKIVINITTIDTALFNLLIQRKDVKIFAVSFKNIDFEMKKRTKKVTDLKIVMSKKYHDFLNVFSKQEADRLLSHRKYDHRIEFEEGKKASIRTSLYRMSKQKLKLIKTYFEEHFDKRFIETLSVFFASSILFAKKSNDELKFCVNYRKLNEITKQNRYLIPLIIDLMTRLSKAKYLTKIDIRHAFNKIKMIIERDKNLTTFRTRLGWLSGSGYPRVGSGRVGFG